MKINKLILLLIISFSTLYLSSQVPVIEQFDILRENEKVNINALFQDTAGYIWVGADEGLFKFDGVNFKQFSTDDSLYNNQISALGKAKNGGFWIGHKNGKITHFDGNKYHKIDPESGFSKQTISSIFEKDSVLWFSTLGEGVYYYKGTKRKRMYNLNTDDGLIDNYVYTILPDTSGLYYMATDRGISVYDRKTDSFIDKINSKDGLPDNLVKDLHLEGHMLWIAMEEGGISRYNTQTKKLISFEKWQYGQINDFECFADQKFWVSTKRNGLIKAEIDSNNQIVITKINKSNGLPDKRLNTVLIDHEGNLWIGSRKGLAINRNNRVEFFNATTDFDIKNIFDITKDNSGKFWVASQDGLYTYSKNRKGEYHLKQHFNSKEYELYAFVSLYKDSNGFIWAGTYGFGAFRINPKTGEFKSYSTKHGLSNNNIIHITGHEESIYFSTLGGGVTQMKMRNNEPEFVTFNTENGLKSDYVYATYPDSQNNIWIATDGGGIAVIEDGKSRTIRNELTDSIGKVVYSIAEDAKGNIWFGTSDNGLIRFDGTDYMHFTKKDGLSSNDIKSIVGYPENHILGAHINEIDIINNNNFSVTNIGQLLALKDFVPNLNAFHIDEQNNLFIGTGNGILKANFTKEDLKLKPRLFISRKQVHYKDIKKGKKEFSHKDNNLTFNYTALWYVNASELFYRYKLVNYDIKWSTPTTTRSVTYSFLPPGEYNFVVQVKMPNGEWYANELSQYAFTIKPPFWQTTWFIILAILTAIAGVYGIIKYRTQKLRRDKDNLEREVARRTTEIRNQKDEIEAQRDEIERQRDYVTNQKDQIEKQNKHITDSIQYASRIQTAVLPPKESFEKLLGDYFIFFKPRDIVSGDFYYLNKSAGKTIVAAADCTGHGVPGAFMSLLGVSFLNQIISQLPDDFNAATVLNMLRDEIKKALRQTGKKDESKDGMDISLCIIDKDSRKLDFAGAYNPLLMARNQKELIYKADRMPIGIHLRDDEKFTNQEIELQAGDMLYMYSDGFQDQFGGAKQQKYLSKRFRKLLIDGSTLPTNEQEKRLNTVFEEWKKDYFQIDDIIVLGIRV